MQNNHRALTLTLMVLTAIFSAAPARAELPPSAYTEMKSKAPEVLQIEVTKVEVTTRDHQDLRHISVLARARVTGINRSASHLQFGDTIALRYTTFEVIGQGWAGPRPLLVVAHGKRYKAWLKKAGTQFFPAAQGQSLEPLS